MKKPIFMGTTQVSALKTAGEIQMLLVAAGAKQIATDFGADQHISGLRWTMSVKGNDWLFALPIRVESVFQLMRKRGPRRSRPGRADRLAATAPLDPGAARVDRGRHG